ncbi:DUF3800 domain-containing protein [Microbispora hainanensis]|uniref:hypothetical protein n=1 Tax=Microbispora hainanensis TaxID=568844 RepID=UPI002E29D6EA|nr:hypothetical protein [Microbispora hainanensis]
MSDVPDTSHQPNDGTALLGDRYSRRNYPSHTQDGNPPGRWIALDESGWDGDQLHGGDRSRYLVIGSVAISDNDAAGIVETLRREARIQAPELKFAKSFTAQSHASRRQALKELLAPKGPLEGRASVYVVDKHYFVVSKLIDLFVEERAHANSVDIRNTGVVRQLARTLFEEGPRALGSSSFAHLLTTTVAFASKKNRDGQKVTVEEFFDVVDAAWARSYRRKVTDVLGLLRSTRSEASAYLRDLQEGRMAEALEPLVPCIVAAIRNWSERIGKLNVLADDQRALTDDQLDLMSAELRGLGHPDFRYLMTGVQLGELVRGQSKSHPSLQLADLISGAGFAVAKRHEGEPTLAGDDLYLAIIPLIDPASMLPHDAPERLAQPGQPPARSS